MGIEAALKSSPMAAGGATTVTVVNLTGEKLLTEELPELNATEILGKLAGTSCFDKLTMDGSMVSGKIEVPAGTKEVTLTLVRVDMGILAGLDEDMMKVLHDFGAVQDVPKEMVLDDRQSSCLSIAKKDEEHCAGGGFGGNSHLRHVLLLPDGRILAKYHYFSDYMEHSGKYDCICTWEIAEGKFLPVKEVPCALELEWTGWCELTHRTTEPFGPGTITGTWEEKLIDPAAKRGPNVLVPTDKGQLSVPELCEKWAKEEANDYGCGRTKSVRVTTSEKMPLLSAELLTTLKMDPRHLPFWEQV